MRTLTTCLSALSIAAIPALAATLCVNPGGSNNCYSSIQSAVNAAHPHDLILVAAGTYKEDVVIGIPLSLVGAGPGKTTIDATNLSNGIYVDGYNHANLYDVSISGFTVENAQWEGILVVSASGVTIRYNRVVSNDAAGPVFNGQPTGCPGQPAFETDETGDCGGGIHLIGASNNLISDNFVTLNADGILISDETGPSKSNVVTRNSVINNPFDCGITLASHAPVGSGPPNFAPHFGVIHTTVSNNLVIDNGVTVGGAGIGLFSDGFGPGRVSETTVSSNKAIHNGIGGVVLHTHAGPAFGALADNMDGNTITGNYIAKNLADEDDTATPGNVGININSGGGGSPVKGMVIANNVIEDEDIDIAINTPAQVQIHDNNLLGGSAVVGAGNICHFDQAACSGAVDATENYWGCAAGPNGGSSCSTTHGPNVYATPWLTQPVKPK